MTLICTDIRVHMLHIHDECTQKGSNVSSSILSRLPFSNERVIARNCPQVAEHWSERPAFGLTQPLRVHSESCPGAGPERNFRWSSRRAFLVRNGIPALLPKHRRGFPTAPRSPCRWPSESAKTRCACGLLVVRKITILIRK